MTFLYSLSKWIVLILLLALLFIASSWRLEATTSISTFIKNILPFIPSWIDTIFYSIAYILLSLLIIKLYFQINKYVFIGGFIYGLLMLLCFFFVGLYKIVGISWLYSLSENSIRLFYSPLLFLALVGSFKLKEILTTP